MAQSVLAVQLAPAAVLRFAVAADCAASGIVTSSEELIGCKAESAMSAPVAALPVLVVISPVTEAGPVAGPVSATMGTVPSALPGCTPVITVAA